MKIDDSQLDFLLQDLETPGDLKDRLNALPDELPLPVVGDSEQVVLAERCDDDVASRRKRIQRWAIAASVVLAASLACLLIVPQLRLPYANLGPKDGPAFNNGARKKLDAEMKAREQAELNALVADVQNNNQKIEHLMKMIELDAKRRQLQLLQNSQPEPIISSEESTSLALALDGQAALELGMELKTVQSQWQDVIQKYPQSAGAELASELLKKSKEN